MQINDMHTSMTISLIPQVRAHDQFTHAQDHFIGPFTSVFSYSIKGRINELTKD